MNNYFASKMSSIIIIKIYFTNFFLTVRLNAQSSKFKFSNVQIPNILVITSSMCFSRSQA